MLATIRNLLIWISSEVLHIFCFLYFEKEQERKLATYAIYLMHVLNFFLWFVISLGDGSSLENTDFNLGYNCMINDWMIMSGVLLVVNLVIAALGYFKIEKLDHEAKFMDPNETRKLGLIMRLRTNMILMISSGLVGSVIMFSWDLLAYNHSVDRLSCEHLFSGDSGFRNVLCFLLKIISMQFNPAVIYYNIYYSRKEDF